MNLHPTAARRLFSITAMALGGVLASLPSRVVAGEAASAFSIFPHDVQISESAPPRLVVSEVRAGRRIDQTPIARYSSLSPDVLAVDETGQVRAIANGQGKIRVAVGQNSADVAFEVVHVGSRPVPDFETDIQPILASSGCSTGACHGKQGGKNGFQLSLLGFDSDFDHAAITKQARGRRIFPAAPELSLLLRKATASVPHGGGRRFGGSDASYHALRDWIENDAPRRSEIPRRLLDVSVEPAELILAPRATHRLVATATFSDGCRRDVTGLTAFSSNESVVADVNDHAVVTAGPIAGEAAIMARFMDQIAVCRVLLPRVDAIDKEIYEKLPRQNLIDDLVWRKLERLNIVPSQPTSDEKFLRRIYIDIVGRQPPADVVRSFLADPAPDRRERMVERLLDHPGYADHWANKWVDLLRPNPYRVGLKAVMSFDHWIREAFRENRPHDQFVRDLLTAQGSTWHNGASTLFRDRRSPDELATMVSQLFLGVRLECAKCHHHPFEVWGQDDFYAFAAFFARLRRKGTGLSPPISGGEEIIFTGSSGNVKHPRTGEIIWPRALGGEEIPADSKTDPRVALVDWMTSDDNPYFAQVTANRVWADLMGRGLVDPVDDIRATNPASNEQLLEALAAHLRNSNYNLKSLIRLITTSQVYRLGSRPNDTNVGDHRNYSRHYRERLRAEVLLDAINQITGSEERFDAMPTGSRPNQVWTHRIPSLFLDTFSRPDRNQDPPCQRVSDTAVVQALHLMNSPKLHQKITNDQGYAAQLARSETAADKIVDELYLRIFCRYPTSDEKTGAVAWFDRASTRRAAVEDLMWALLNSAEFVFKD